MLTECPSCQARASLPDEKAGSKVRCLDCGRVYVAHAAGPRARGRLERRLWLVAAALFLAVLILAIRRFQEGESSRARAEPPAAVDPGRPPADEGD
jgi:predicted Zn finger-like uncharacterized protein